MLTNVFMSDIGIALQPLMAWKVIFKVMMLGASVLLSLYGLTKEYEVDFQ